jgi:hypothetical protein
LSPGFFFWQNIGLALSSPFSFKVCWIAVGRICNFDCTGHLELNATSVFADYTRDVLGLQAAMSIIESYILLGGADFLRLHASGMVKIFEIVVGNVKERGMLCTLPVIDSLIQVLH